SPLGNTSTISNLPFLSSFMIRLAPGLLFKYTLTRAFRAASSSANCFFNTAFASLLENDAIFSLSSFVCEKENNGTINKSVYKALFFIIKLLFYCNYDYAGRKYTKKTTLL